MLTIKKRGIFLLSNPELSYIALFNKQNLSVLRHYSLMDHRMSMSAKVEIKDKDGNIIPQPMPPEPIWSWAFRYYRLSQASRDIFEAYRNLYLSFESLLNGLCQIKNGEREGAWLKRALTQVSNEISFTGIVPGGIEKHVEYIFQRQYKGMRCKLLHAKDPDALLPHSQLSPTNVVAAYEELMRLWQHIATKKYFVPSGGGIFTYGGFRLLMDRVFSGGMKFCFTDDNSPAKEDDTQISPTGKKVVQFESYNYLGESKPGFVALQGSISITEQFNEIPISRICGVMDENILYNVVHLSFPLIAMGADVFETLQEIRLINSEQPKTNF